MREWFEGFGEKARAATKAGMVFLGISLLAAIFATHGLLATANGFASVCVLIALIVAVVCAINAARRTYDRAFDGGDE